MLNLLLTYTFFMLEYFNIIFFLFIVIINILEAFHKFIKVAFFQFFFKIKSFNSNKTKLINKINTILIDKC